jgi:hypothetical protein
MQTTLSNLHRAHGLAPSRWLCQLGSATGREWNTFDFFKRHRSQALRTRFRMFLSIDGVVSRERKACETVMYVLGLGGDVCDYDGAPEGREIFFVIC